MEAAQLKEDRLAYRNTKPDSPKGQVYTRYAGQGQEAALAHGHTLGIDDKRMLRWFGQWGDPSKVIEPSRQPRVKNKLEGKPRVCRLGDTKCRGTVTIEGEQQSEVLWDSGLRQFENNKFLLPLRPKSKREEE